MIERKTLVGRLEVKFAQDGTAEKTFTGYGARFGNVDSYNDIIEPGAFVKTIARHTAAGTMPAMLWNHDSFAMPIGKWGKMSEDTNGLSVSGSFVNTQAGQDVYTLVKADAVTGLSIGYFVKDSHTIGDIRHITEVDLLEISVVTFPANDLARIEDVKNMRDTEYKAKAEEAMKLAQDALLKLNALVGVKAAEDGDDCDCDEDEECDCDNAEDVSDEAKYNEAAIMAAIKSVVTTAKEINVRN